MHVLVCYNNTEATIWSAQLIYIFLICKFLESRFHEQIAVVQSKDMWTNWKCVIFWRLYTSSESFDIASIEDSAIDVKAPRTHTHCSAPTSNSIPILISCIILALWCGNSLILATGNSIFHNVDFFLSMLLLFYLPILEQTTNKLNKLLCW